MSNRSSSSINKTENLGLKYTNSEAKLDKTVPEILSSNSNKSLNQSTSFYESDNLFSIDQEQVLKKRFLFFEPTNLESKKVVQITKLRQSIKNSLKKLIHFLTRPEPLGSSFILLLGLFSLKRANTNFSTFLPIVKDCLPSFNEPSQEISWESYQFLSSNFRAKHPPNSFPELLQMNRVGLTKKEWHSFSESKKKASFVQPVKNVFQVVDSAVSDPKAPQTFSEQSTRSLRSSTLSEQSTRCIGGSFYKADTAGALLGKSGAFSYNDGDGQRLNRDNIVIQNSIFQLQNFCLKQKGFFALNKNLPARSFFLTNTSKPIIGSLFPSKAPAVSAVAPERVELLKERVLCSEKVRYMEMEPSTSTSKAVLENFDFEKKKFGFSRYKIIPGQFLTSIASEKVAPDKTKLLESLKNSLRYWYNETDDFASKMSSRNVLLSKDGDEKDVSKKTKNKEKVKLFKSFDLFPYQTKLLKDLKGTYYKSSYRFGDMGRVFEKKPNYLSNFLNKKTATFLDKKDIILEKANLLQSYSFNEVSSSKPFFIGFKTPVDFSVNKTNPSLQINLSSDRVIKPKRKENQHSTDWLFKGEILNLTRTELNRAEQDWLKYFQLAVFEKTEKQRAIMFPVRKLAPTYTTNKKEVFIKPRKKQELSLKQLTLLEQSKVVSSLKRSLSLFERLCFYLDIAISQKLKENGEKKLSGSFCRRIGNLKQKKLFPFLPSGLDGDIDNFSENSGLPGFETKSSIGTATRALSGAMAGTAAMEKSSVAGDALLNLESNNLKKANSTKFVLTDGELEEKDSEKDGEKDGETKAPLEDLSLWLNDWSDWAIWSSKTTLKNRNKVLATETSQLRKKMMTVLRLPYEKVLRLTGKDLLYSVIETIEDGHTKDSFKGQPPTPDQDDNSFRLSKPMLTIKGLLAGINSWEYNNHFGLTEEEISFWPLVKPRPMASYRFLDLKSNDLQQLYALINYKDLLTAFSWSSDIGAPGSKTLFDTSVQNKIVCKSSPTLPLIVFSGVTRGALKERVELMTNALFNQANAKRLFLSKTIPQVSVKRPATFTFGTFLGSFEKPRLDLETSISRFRKTRVHQHYINKESTFRKNYTPVSFSTFSLNALKSQTKDERTSFFVNALSQTESSLENQLLTKSFLPITNSIKQFFENISSEARLSSNNKEKTGFILKKSKKRKTRTKTVQEFGFFENLYLPSIIPSVTSKNKLQVKEISLEKGGLCKGLVEKPIQFRVRYNLFSSKESKIESKNAETSNKKTIGSLLNFVNTNFGLLNKFNKQKSQRDFLLKDAKRTKLSFSVQPTKKINVVNSKKHDNLFTLSEQSTRCNGNSFYKAGTAARALVSETLSKGRQQKIGPILKSHNHKEPFLKQTNLSNNVNERSYLLVGLLTRTANQDVLVKQRDKWLCAQQLPNLLSNRSLTHSYKSNLAFLESVTSVNKKANKLLDFSRVPSIAKEQKPISSSVLSWFLKPLPNKAKSVLFPLNKAKLGNSVFTTTGSLFQLQSEPLYFGQAPSLWPFSYRNTSSPNRARVKSGSKTLDKGQLFNSEAFWGPGLNKSIKKVSSKTFFSPNSNKTLRTGKQTRLKETKESFLKQELSLISDKSVDQGRQTSLQTWFVGKNSPKALKIGRKLERVAQTNNMLLCQNNDEVSSKKIKVEEQWLGPFHKHSLGTRAWWADKEKNALSAWLKARLVDMYFINTRLGLAQKVAWWKKDYAGPIIRKININDTIGDYIKECKDKESFTNLTNQQLRLLANSYPRLESLESESLRVLESEDKWYWGLSKIEAELNPKKEQEEESKKEKQINHLKKQETTSIIKGSTKSSGGEAKHLAQEKLNSSLPKQPFDIIDKKKDKQIAHFSLKSFSQVSNNFAGLLAQPTLPLVSANWEQETIGQKFNEKEKSFDNPLHQISLNNKKEKGHESATLIADKEKKFPYTNFASQNQQLIEFSSPWYNLANSRLLYRKTLLDQLYNKKLYSQVLHSFRAKHPLYWPLLQKGWSNGWYSGKGKKLPLLNKKAGFPTKLYATHSERKSQSVVYSKRLQKLSLFQITKQPLNKKAWKGQLALNWPRTFAPPHKNETLFETEYGPSTGRVGNDGFFEIGTVGNKSPNKRPLFNSLTKKRDLVIKSNAFKFNRVKPLFPSKAPTVSAIAPPIQRVLRSERVTLFIKPIQRQVERAFALVPAMSLEKSRLQGLVRQQKLENLKRTQQFSWEAISLYSWLAILQWSFVLLAAAVLIDLYRTFGVAGLETAFEKAKKEGLTETPLMMYYQNVFKLSSPTQDFSYQLYSKIENKFKNVRGVERHFPELAELVWWLRHGKKRFPSPTSGSRGYLLVGPPGTGKTLLVKALAGESEVPLLCQSMSLLCGKQGGDTNQYSSKLANLEHLEMVFDRARESNPCLIFLDEIDSIGSARSNISSKWVTQLGHLLLGDFEKRTTPSRSLYNQLNTEQLEDNPVTPRLWTLDDQAVKSPGLQEMGLDPYEAPPIGPWRRGLLGIPAYYSWKTKLREKVFQASNQQTSFMLSLLQELDGIKTRSGVVVLASTNRPETLDQALLRPGRLERILHMELPNKNRRLDILKKASQYLGAELTVSWEDLAARTVGWSHAALTTAVNESTLRALTQGTRHTVESIDWGLDLVTNDRPMPPHFSQRKRTAFFQAGKAVLSRLLPNHPPVWRIRLDVVPHTQRRYKSRYRPLLEQLDGLSLYQSRGPLETCLIGLYGGKAGEIMYLKERNWSCFDVQSFSHSFCRGQVSVEPIIKRGLLSSIGSEEINNATTLAWLMVDYLGFYGKRLGLKHAFQLPTTRQTRIEWRLLNSWKRWYSAGIAEDVARSWTLQPNFQTLGRIQINDPFVPWFNRSASLVGSKWKDQNLPWYLQQQSSFAKNLNWYRIYTQFRQERYQQMQHKLPEQFAHGHDRQANLVDISQRYQIQWNDIYPLQRDYLIHGLILNSFTVACLILDQYREILDLYASELLRYGTLHANHMKQLMLLCQDMKNINPSFNKK